MPSANRWIGLHLGFQDFCYGQMGTNAAFIKKIKAKKWRDEMNRLS